MSSLERLNQDLTYVTDSLKYWWRINGEDQFRDTERSGWDRWSAEQALLKMHGELDRELKIQLTAGEKAVELFSFDTDSYDFMTINRRFGARYDLRPNETLDLVHMRPQLSNTLSHGQLRTLYAGHTLHAHGIGIAEALSVGGELTVVPADTEETHSLGK